MRIILDVKTLPGGFGRAVIAGGAIIALAFSGTVLGSAADS